MSQHTRPIVLTIAALDSAGMAGLAQDIRTQRAFGVHTASVAIATTAQNNFALLSINPVDPKVLQDQLDAVKDLPISVVKVGLLCNLQQVQCVAEFIESTGLPMILDPVLATSSGAELFPRDAVAAYVDRLLPLTTLVTPNRYETAELAYLSVNDAESVELAAESLMLLGARNVLIKGGHADSELCQDYFASESRRFWLTSPRQKVRHTRGSGCALASSIASCLALGYPLEDALVIAKMALNQGLRDGYSAGEQQGPVDIAGFPGQGSDIPWLTEHAEVNLNREAFPACHLVAGEQRALGLYPIVDRAEWLEKLLPLGVTTVQLRCKDLRSDALKREIEQAVNLARHYDSRLFINDHWQLAVDSGAYGVHLGQEDLESADLDAIRDAGLKLGVSTHCHYEVSRALACKPSYIACGPVFPTNTKRMPWQPHGIDGLRYWVDALNCPVVAIAGINAERIAEVAATQVNGIALITAITQAADPISATQSLLAHFN